jgi:hypothetical protein
MCVYIIILKPDCDKFDATVSELYAVTILLQTVKHSCTHCTFFSADFFAFTEAIQVAGVEQWVHIGMLLGIVYDTVLLQTLADWE